MMSSMFSYFKNPKVVYTPPTTAPLIKPPLTPTYQIQPTLDPLDRELTDVLLSLSDKDLMSHIHHWLNRRPHVIINIVIGERISMNSSITEEVLRAIINLLAVYPNRVQLLVTPKDLVTRSPSSSVSF